MAKKDDKKIEPEGESKGSRIVSFLIALVIILIWLAVFCVLIKLDVGGLGSHVLYPVLKDVPVVNRILPDVKDDSSDNSSYEYTDLKSANAKIKELEAELASKNSSTTADSDYIKQLENKVKELQKYKDSQDDFNKRVADFDKNVVFNSKAPSISEYRKYYEEIDPENAEKIYKQVIARLQASEKVKQLGSYYAAMDAGKAAAALSEMNEDLTLVSQILESMSESKAAAILNEMDPTYAAQITKKISLSAG
ncbi:MAG: hypothetical protein VZR00_00990 [Lachnospiraceae bacterium]|jgi:flagellar motility protein MotE (MotC chaperone)|nr:hypothetical protein [Lachnospiraceae bacterium]MEE3460452.1 hypothetical protein [Lachnospiraceae bacterium]